MEGFRIGFRDRELKVGFDDGLLMIHLVDYAGREAVLRVRGVDYAASSRVKWLECPLRIGDRIELEYKVLDRVSAPLSVQRDRTVRRPFTKLEWFRDMECYLKNKGLL